MYRLAGFVLLALLAASPARAEGEINLCPAVRSEKAALPEFYAAREMRNGQDGWLFSRRDFNHAQRLNAESRRQLKRLVRILEQRGVHLASVLVPNRLWASRSHYDETAYLPFSYNELKSVYLERIGQLRELGVLAPDLQTPLELTPPAFDFFFKRDHHWTPAGAAYAAQLVANELNSQPFMRALPQSTYTLLPAGSAPHKGSYSAYAEKVCGLQLEPERLDKYTLDAAAPASLLDSSLPPVVLVGTSFSNPMFGFPAALQAALGREVENAAVDGGGTDTGLIAFLSSRRFADIPPSLIVWEIPYLYSYNLPEMWRQVVPAAAGACSDANALAASTQALGSEVRLLDSLNQRVRPGRDFVYLETDDLGLTTFDLRFEYADDQSETVHIQRSGRAANSGRFFVELGPNYTANLRSLTLTSPTPTEGQITTRLCEGRE